MTQRIPTYRHHKPSDQAVVTLNGKDFYLGPWDSTASREEYDRVIAEWIANGRQIPTARKGADLTVAELAVAYLRFAKDYYADNGETTSEYTCLRQAIKPLRDLYSRIVVKDFGPLALRAVRQRMIEGGLCRTHINQRINRIRRLFKWGVENEFVPPGVLEALRAVAPLKKGRTEARESKPVRPVPDEHVDAILPHVSRQVAAMIELQRLTGMRAGEVVLMRPCDVDQRGDVWVYRPMRHKTAYRGHQREIYLGPQAQKVLAPLLLRGSKLFCFSPAEAEAERNAKRKARRKTPLTPSQAMRKPKPAPKRPKRARFDVASYRRAITYAIKKTGTPHWHPHQLRHSCATRVRREFGLDVAQVILGHQCADVTQVYAEVERSKALDAVTRSG